MALTTATIRGAVPLADSSAPGFGAFIEFQLTGWDTDQADNATVLNGPVRELIGNDGEIEARLWPNDRGLRGTQYRVTVRLATLKGWKSIDLGRIEVPGTGTYNLEDLLGVIENDLENTWQELAEAVAAAQAAAAAATSARDDAADFAGYRQFQDMAALKAASLNYTDYPVESVIRTRAEGFSYKVALAVAADHHVEINGVKIYVLPDGGWYNAGAFDAQVDGTDAYPAIQKALEVVGDNGNLIIPPGNYTLSDTPTIPLSTNSNGRLNIHAYGAVFEITGANAGLARERPPSNDSVYTNAKICVRGLTVRGDTGTGGQHGFRFFTTYGLVIEDCHAINCEIGYCLIFCMMANISTNFATNCYKYGFFLGSGGSQVDFGGGAETSLTGGAYSNSNSNGAVLERCRVFARSGSEAHFKIEACEASLLHPIVEGNAGANCFEYDNFGSTQSRGISIIDPHVECTPTNAIYKFHTSVGTIGGTFLVEGQDTVITTSGWDGYMLDLGATLGSGMVVLFQKNKTTYRVNKLVKGNNSGRWPEFIIDTMDPDDWLDPARWGSGEVGNVTTSSPISNSSNEMFTLGTFQWKAFTGYTDWTTTSAFYVNTGREVVFNVGGGRDFEVHCEGANDGLILDGRLFAKEAEAVESPTLGNVVGRMRIHDKDKNFIGFMPIYDSIS